MESDEIERIRRETEGEKYRTNLRQSYFACRMYDESYVYGEESRTARIAGGIGSLTVARRIAPFITIPAGGETREFAALRDHVHTITRRISEANTGKEALWYLSPHKVVG